MLLPLGSRPDGVPLCCLPIEIKVLSRWKDFLAQSGSQAMPWTLQLHIRTLLQSPRQLEAHSRPSRQQHQRSGARSPGQSFTSSPRAIADNSRQPAFHQFPNLLLTFEDFPLSNVLFEAAPFLLFEIPGVIGAWARNTLGTRGKVVK